MNDQIDFYSPEQVAEQLGLHVRTVRRFIHEGKLKAARIGKQYRIHARDFSDFVGTNDPQRLTTTVNRRRRVIVSTTVDIEAISKEETYRVTTSLMGAFKSSRNEQSGKRLDCIYYEEQGRLRIVINADLHDTNAVLGLINGLVNDGWTDRGN